MTRINGFRLLFLLYILLVSYLSLSKPTALTDVSSWDKIAHSLAYLMFAALGYLASSTPRQFRLTMIGCIGFGGMIEYLQGLTPYRTSSWLDMLANVTGLACGILLIQLLRWFYHQRKPGV